MKRKVLMTVDYQGSFASPTGELYVPEAETIADNIQINIDNDFFSKRIVSFDTHNKEEYINSKECKIFGFDLHCEYKTDGWKLFNIKMPTQDVFEEKIEEMKSFSMIEIEGDVYFTKNDFDIWTGNDEFENWVNNNLNVNMDAIYIQGVATNYCVYMNAMGFVNRGFEVCIIENAVKAIPDDSMNINEQKLKDAGVKFINDFDIYVHYFSEMFAPTITKTNEIINNIRIKIKKYVSDNNLKSLVVGISGGLDSAVIAAICQEKYTGVPLIGISIPLSSTNAHKEQAKWVGEQYCTSFKEFKNWEDHIDSIFNILESTDDIAFNAGFNSEMFPKNILKGNMKARLRMITVYDLARKTNGMVLSTDNLSEYLMGFWTINGDVGDYGPIQNIGKGFELPKIAEVLGVRQDIITQPPSDGLMVTEDNTDEAQLGANYQEVDVILFNELNIVNIPEHMKIKYLDFINNDKVVKIIKRYKDLGYKRIGTVNITRQEIGI